MTKQIIHGQASTTIIHPERCGEVVIQTVADVSTALDRAKALHNAGRTKTKMGDRHVASIPIIVLDAWAKARGKTYADVMRDKHLFDQFLSDPDNSGWIIDKASV